MRIFIAAACAVLVSAGFAQAQEVNATARMEAPDAKDLGTVTFTQTESGMLHVIIEMTGLPAGPHGFHVHDRHPFEVQLFQEGCFPFIPDPKEQLVVTFLQISCFRVQLHQMDIALQGPDLHQAFRFVYNMGFL